MRWSVVSDALAVCGLAAAALACGPEPYSGPVTGKILLRYHPPAGARYAYAFSQVSTMKEPNGPMAGMGEQRIELAMWFNQQVGPTEGSGAGVGLTAVIDSARVTSPLVGGDVARQLAGARTTMIVDDHLRVLRADPASPLSHDASQVAEQMVASLRTMSFPLPDSAVGPGDSWMTPMQVPYTDFAGGEPVFATTRLAVQSLEVVRGDTVVGFTVEVQLPHKPIPVVVMGQPGTISLSGTIAGTQKFSLNRGAILATEYSGTVVVTMSGGTLGPNAMHLDIGQEASLTLLDGRQGGR